METLAEAKYKTIRIRVLIVMRSGKGIYDMEDIINRVAKSSSVIIASAYNNGEFIQLSSPKKYIHEIQKSFAEKHGKILTENDYEALHNLLINVDGYLLRPLYIIMLVDAYLDDPAQSIKWDKSEALDYIVNKEIQNINSVIINSCGDIQDLTTIAKFILIDATIVGGFNFYEDFELLLPNEYEDLHRLTHTAQDSFYQIQSLFSYAEGIMRVLPLEPDIIGEYFVIKECQTLLQKNKRKWENMIALLSKYKPTFIMHFWERLNKDFDEILHEEIMQSINIFDLFRNGCAFDKDHLEKYGKLMLDRIHKNIIAPEELTRYFISYCNSMLMISGDHSGIDQYYLYPFDILFLLMRKCPAELDNIIYWLKDELKTLTIPKGYFLLDMYAQSLMTKSIKANYEECSNVIKEFEIMLNNFEEIINISIATNNDHDIHECYCVALVNYIAKQNPHDAISTIEKIKIMYAKHPDDMNDVENTFVGYLSVGYFNIFIKSDMIDKKSILNELCNYCDAYISGMFFVIESVSDAARILLKHKLYDYVFYFINSLKEK